MPKGNENLKHSAPYVYQYFTKCQYVLRIKAGSFKCVTSDTAHGQTYNIYMKETCEWAYINNPGCQSMNQVTLYKASVVLGSMCIKPAHDQSLHCRLQQLAEYCHGTESHCNHQESSGNRGTNWQDWAPEMFEWQLKESPKGKASHIWRTIF